MPTTQIRTEEEIQRRQVARIISRTSLSDFTASAVGRHISGAGSREADALYYELQRLSARFALRGAHGLDLDERVRDLLPPFAGRRPAQPSVGQVVLFASGAVGAARTYERGTIVRGRSGFLAQTTSTAVIGPANPIQVTGHVVGQDSFPVTAVALRSGEFEVGLGEIVAAQGSLPGLAGATNVTTFIGGRNAESDEELLDRTLRTVAGLARCTPLAAEGLTKDLIDPVSLKRSVVTKLWESVADRGSAILYVDDGGGTAGETLTVAFETQILAVGGETIFRLLHYPVDEDATFTLRRNGVTMTEGVDYFVNVATGWVELSEDTVLGAPLVAGDVIDGSYTYFVGLIAFMQRVIDGDPLDRVNFPGVRSWGVLGRARPMGRISFTVAGVVTPKPGVARGALVTQAQQEALSYVNSLAGDVIWSELLCRIKDIPGMYDFSLTAPTGNVVVPAFAVPRISLANVSIS